MKFTAEIKLRGINPYVLVSAARVRRIKNDWKKPIPVLAQVNGKPHPARPVNMMPAGDGSFYLYLDGSIRKNTETHVGDNVEISISFDHDYQSGPQHDIPLAFAARLQENPSAQSRWNSLSLSLRKEILRYLANLKSQEALARNIERAIRVLNGSNERLLARDWS